MATAAQPLVSLYEYLHSDYQPDMDYVDGTLEERNLGEHDHADLQSELLVLFRNRRNEWQVKAVVEQRVQVSATRYRVPDLCVLPVTWQREPIITTPPLLCVEVLSPEDRLSRMRERCGDYLRMGVPRVWIFDPEAREALVLRPDGTTTTHREGTLTVQGTPIAISLPELFAVLEEG